MKNKPKIVVFVRNKLITTDTVLPLLLEAKNKFDISSKIVVFDKLAHDSINKNIVIKDTIKHIGGELYITNGLKSKFLRRLNILFFLLLLIIGFFKGDKIIHFGHLNRWPLKFIAIFFKKNTYQMQGTAYGFEYSHINRSSKKLEVPYPVGQNIIICAKNIEKTAFNNLEKEKKVFRFGETRTRDTWVKYISENADYYFNKYHPNLDINNGFIVFILGTIHGYEHKYDLFKSTIEILSGLNSPLPILLKPHTFTEMNTVEEAIANLDLFHITYLHPSVLASKARIFVSNNFSNTLADAHSYGVKTIEFTSYDHEKRKRLKGQSTDPQFVDYFIDNDKNKLLESLNEVLNQKYNQSSFKGYDRGDDGLFKSFLN